MNRRQYLARVGAIGTIPVAAGCLASDDEPEREAADRTGERALDRAVGELNRAALALDEDLGDVGDPDESSFDADEPRDLIASALDHLETAEDALADDRAPDVDELRAYADVLDRLVDVAVVITDDGLADDIETVSATIEDEGDTETAIETVDERNETLAEAREWLDGADADLDGLDADRLEELSIAELADVAAGVDRLDEVLAAMQALGSGYESLLEGQIAIDGGKAAFDAENYEAAAEEFATAAESFESSTDTFDDGHEGAPDGLASQFETARCQSDALETAAEHFEAAANAAVEHDVATAERRLEDGEDALEDARACS